MVFTSPEAMVEFSREKTLVLVKNPFKVIHPMLKLALSSPLTYVNLDSFERSLITSHARPMLSSYAKNVIR